MSKEEKDMGVIASSLLEQIEEQIARADSSKLQLSLLACFTPVLGRVLAVFWPESLSRRLEVTTLFIRVDCAAVRFHTCQ